MKCNVKLDVTDAQRNALAQLLTGKAVKRLATREEVAAYVLGAVEGLERPVEEAPEPVTARAQAEAPRNPLTEAERAEVNRLVAEGRTPGWIRGWIYAGRRIKSAA